VEFAKEHLLGERSGDSIGTKLDIVQKNALKLR